MVPRPGPDAVAHACACRAAISTNSRTSGDRSSSAQARHTWLCPRWLTDHLVYTAGEPLALMSVDALDLAAARTAFDLRYFGSLSAVNAALPYLRPGGSITLTTGTANHRPSAGWSVAASITGAIDALVRALAVKLAPIRVNAVSAGVIRSPLWDSLPEETREQMYAQLSGSLPLRRVGEPEEVAEAFVYLLRATYATGTVVTVDGGTLVA
ncbi:SDR family oxidoreductase [Micromonospora zamorensis]|uniref:SDR family oxidoreductase n=1 Tax=Micromonospora zamorensis TaxID=709883 RepID=UPI003D999FDD